MPRGLPGKLTFLDPLSSYLQVEVEIPADIAAEQREILYPDIRDTFFAAIEKAMETLHYDARAPEVSFLCPKQSSHCSEMPHTATIDDSQRLLVCSVKPSTVWCPLTDEQKIWLRAVPGT